MMDQTGSEKVSRPPGWSITVLSTVFNKAVFLSYAFTLDPYNPKTFKFKNAILEFAFWARVI